MRESQGELNLVGRNISIATALDGRAGDGGGSKSSSGESCGAHCCVMKVDFSF
jgi:hypothetical protein